MSKTKNKKKGTHTTRAHSSSPREDITQDTPTYEQLHHINLKTIEELHALFPHWKRNSIQRKIRETLDGKDVRFIAKVRGHIVAHVKIRLGKGLHRHRAEMTSLAVIPAHRGKGIAAELTKYSVEQLPDKITLIILAVDKKNKRARALYSKLGFEEFGLLPKASIVGNRFVDNVFLYKSK